MPTPSPRSAVVVGGGPVGCVLAVLLARRGLKVSLYEKRPDMREAGAAGGRSINLVLTRRGLRALAPLGLLDEVLELTVPVLGRMIHDDGEQTFQPYGKDETECTHSISRGRLNAFLLDAAEAAGVEVHFGHELVDATFAPHDRQAPGQLHFATGESGRRTVEAAVVFGADGAPSGVREALVNRHGFTAETIMLDYGYKELLFPAGPGGSPAMAGHALHIWPRGWHMLMGLANLDGSFTGTIYLPWEGEESFGSLKSRRAVRAFFDRHYPDAIGVLGDFEQEFVDHPTGHLGTVRAWPWHLDGRALLVGDAAHAIVPFFGQGLNCGFEDCLVLDGLLAEHGDDLAAAFAAFGDQRKANADAIADMALENFIEMRDKVADDRFILRKQVESLLERELTDVYRTRYAMVMYSSIPYSVAYEAGKIQDAILAELTEGLEAAEGVDLARARALIEARLAPLLEREGASLDF